MTRDNINNEINEFRIFSILYKTVLKNKKTLIINSIFITIFYIIYLLLSGSFSTTYKVSQDLIIFKRLRKFEISSNSPLKDESCLIFDTKSVYYFAKSNQFLNSFFSQIEVKYPRNIYEIKQNFKIGPFAKNFFSVDVVDENQNIASSIINDFSLILNKSLIDQNKQCNLVNFKNQSFNFKNWQDSTNTKNKSIIAKLGCIAAHRKALLAIYSNQTNNNLILEEDATLTGKLPPVPKDSCYMGGWIIPPQINRLL